MGVFLDKPKKEKDLEAGEGNGLRYALCSMQGWRVEMEDAHSIRVELSPKFKNCSYFAVFDGHAGDFVSKYSSQNLLDTILNLCSPSGSDASESVDNELQMQCKNDSDNSYLHSLEDLDKFKAKIIEGFLALDKNMRELPKFSTGEEKSGTTAIAVFITEDNIIFANCGDSRAVLCSNKSVKLATQDHKPYCEKEKLRIENAGGSVMVQRVNGSLAVSRALGDYDYKNVIGFSQTEQLVSPEPDIITVQRSSDDEFLIIACDGVWDVMSNEEVVDYIRARLKVHQCLEKVCEELLETCLAKGSRDNMSAILVVFPAAPQLSPEAVEKEEKLELAITEKIDEIVKKYGDKTTLTAVIEDLKNFQFENLPPGGGIQAKVCLIEKRLDELLPNRDKDEGRFGALGSVPMTMIRSFASGPNDIIIDQDDEIQP
ncbi:protein phosphatase 1A isoform X2 [Hydra vulgaris]|uniref:Protein phosphatase 1A isoform X2 n=1 Tax=Hydra vulgaris TaxID=6087 RepID=A0ABM4CJG3_HYDVU